MSTLGQAKFVPIFWEKIKQPSPKSGWARPNCHIKPKNWSVVQTKFDLVFFIPIN